MSTNPSSSSRRPFTVTTSAEFPQWLESLNTSLAFSTYQLGKIFFVGLKGPGRVSMFERTFNRCMGLWSDTQTLWLASAFQLWRLENMLADDTKVDDYFDRLFVPMRSITTGDIDVHDIVVDPERQLYFVNTLFSCIATVDPRYNFQPVWKPPFVTKLAAKDCCHLNGMTLTPEGKLGYATACGQTDQAGGWREQRTNGGCLIDMASNEIIASGLSMPHSPRFYRDKLWVLDSGNGYFGFVDTDQGKFERVAFCPGYARGLTFIDKYAIIGLSQPRDKTFAGLALDDELGRHGAQPQCGLQVVDLEKGTVAQWLAISGNVEELYDVIVLPGVRMPKAFGLKTDEIRRNTWFRDNGKVVRWTAAEPDS